MKFSSHSSNKIPVIHSSSKMFKLRQFSRYSLQKSILHTTYGPLQGLHVICRQLYAANTMGVDGFKDAQEKIRSQFTNMTERFRGKMQEFSDLSSTNMIFTEDLKNMIHLAENTKDDINLVTNMLVKFHKQNMEMQFGNYVFGPVVMRMFYCMQNFEEPLKLFKNPQLNDLFNQVVSYQILMDMLYNGGHYQEILDLYTTCKNDNFKEQRHIVVLVLAACYKLNTKESLDFALNLWRHFVKTGKIPMRKSATFAAGLALKQNDPAIALEMVSVVRQQSYITVKNIKILAMLRMKRYNDVLMYLKKIVEEERASGTTQSMSKEVLQEIRSTIVEKSDKELYGNVQKICKIIEESGQVSEKNLDELLTMEITMTSVNAPRGNTGYKNVLAGSFRSSPMGKSSINPRFVRPGLADLK